ncbi:MAG: formate dehydrogenase accessory sulfurtransferase FdhD [Opitutaceae bacterium]
MSSSDPIPHAFAASVLVARHSTGREPEMRDDLVAVEEPLEIRVNGQPFAVIMRTPGHDLELSAGYLLSEGIVSQRRQIVRIGPCLARAGGEIENVVAVELTEIDARKLRTLARHSAVGSSCGTCGKTSIEQVHQNFPALAALPPAVTIALLQSFPARLAEHQAVFRATGGLHGAALFRDDGTLVKVREDVGRHNAVDKVLGWALLNDALPLVGTVLFVSGRISFEIVQKALAARITVMAGISAPTSLAVEFARASGQTLVGFVRDGRANVYAGTLR